MVTMKPLNFVGSSLDDLRNFPDEARRAAGFELRAVQSGLEPSDWKPMQVINPGVNEIRIHVLGEWRVIYVAKLRDAVYVLHAFKRRLEKQANMTLIWPANGTGRLEVTYERGRC
jgi:phage-related protein